jgi:hypothetical protein
MKLELWFDKKIPDPDSGISAPAVSGHVITTKTRSSLTSEMALSLPVF